MSIIPIWSQTPDGFATPHNSLVSLITYSDKKDRKISKYWREDTLFCLQWLICRRCLPLFVFLFKISMYLCVKASMSNINCIVRLHLNQTKVVKCHTTLFLSVLVKILWCSHYLVSIIGYYAGYWIPAGVCELWTYQKQLHNVELGLLCLQYFGL